LSDAQRLTPASAPDLLKVVADALADSAELDAALETMLTAAVGALGADTALVLLHDPDRVGLEPVVAIGLDDGAVERIREGAGTEHDPIFITLRERTGLRAVRGESGGAFLEVTGSVRGIFEPLVVTRGGIELSLGMLALGWGTGTAAVGDASGARATRDDGAVVRAVARLAGVAVDRARLASLVAERSEWLERMAHTDPLTGLANQRAFEQVIEVELARAGRQGTELAIALFDVDGFIATNAAGGHDAGDDVLRSVAAVLNESVRVVDTVARIGGDEFALVAPGPAGAAVVKRVLAGVAALPAVADRPISLSAGIARFPGDAATADQLLGIALSALAEAKSEGPGTAREASALPAA
jgi:diguanylate cyclase (GGDEF)-like protein